MSTPLPGGSEGWAGEGPGERGRRVLRSPLSAILWAKRRLAANAVAELRRHSRLKVAFVTVSAVLLWIGIFVLARIGFYMFESFGSELLGAGTLSLSDLVMSRMLAVFALALFVMLIFSNVLVSFQTLYRAREVAYLIQAPISTPTLFLGRFYECVTFSSWASAFLGSPILLAYGVVTAAPPVFYLSLAAFYLPFVVIPAAIGAMATMALVRVFARLRGGPWATLAIVTGVGLFVVFRGALQVPDFSETSTLQAVIEAMGRTQSPFLPSYWLAHGILSAATGDLGEALFYWLLLLANALLLAWLAAGLAEQVFAAGWSALQGGAAAAKPGRGRARRRTGLGWLDVVLRPLPQPTRALVIKDVRLFWRDTAQWSQFVLLFGIMALYLANMRGMSNLPDQAAWRPWGTLLNLGASMLILASLTTRFVYPLISLEGRRFWILGLSPVTMRRVVWQKFFLSVACTSVFTVGLALLSAVQLGLDRLSIVLSVTGVAATTVALSGLAVGLGSLYPSFDEDNPARVVSGMGGTLNFILSMVYILLVTAALGVVMLWGSLERHFGSGAFPWVVASVLAWMAGLTAVTCWVPLRLGLRNLERAEF